MEMKNGAQSVTLIPGRKIILSAGVGKTNIDELIGKEAVVIKAIEPYMAGEVKLDGKIWRAVSESKRVYQVDEIVVVLRIEGVTIITK